MDNTSYTCTQEAMDLLETALKDMYLSGRYHEYISIMSQFHLYSMRNILLASIQLAPHRVSYLGSFAFWKRMGFHIRKGENGLRILVPITHKRRYTKVAVDEDGEEFFSEQEKIYTSFRSGIVFDICQTVEGPSALPTLVQIPEYSSDTLEKAVQQLILSDGCIRYDDGSLGSANGSYNRVSGEIRLKPGFSASMTLRILFHEKAHSILHSKDADELSRSLRELEAETVSFCCCRRLGLDGWTIGYTTGYLASWSGAEFPMPALLASLDRIAEATRSILSWVTSTTELTLSKGLTGPAES